MTPLHILSPVAKYRHPQNHASIRALAECGHYDVSLYESLGISEVARARNHVAGNAYPRVKEEGGLVFWWDADMVLPSLDTFFLHDHVVKETSLAISGRYVTRQDQSRVAASLDEKEKRTRRTRTTEKDLTIQLTPLMAGLGCLLLPAEEFLLQYENSPLDDCGEKRIVCCPRVELYREGEGEEEDRYVMVSEDFDYCRSLPGGAWYAHVQAKGGSFESFLDYAHMVERPAMHARRPHNLEKR